MNVGIVFRFVDYIIIITIIIIIMAWKDLWLKDTTEPMLGYDTFCMYS